MVEGISAGQLIRVVADFEEICRKNKCLLPKDGVQKVLDNERTELVIDMFNLFRARVESQMKMISRVVMVNRVRTPQDALNATGRVQHVNREVVDSMPVAEGNKVEVVFFKPESWEYTKPGEMSHNDIEKILDNHGLKFADPISVAAVNEVDPTFGNKYPNGTQWKDSDGKWCVAKFGMHTEDFRDALQVHRGDEGWMACWWFACIRKK